MKCIPQERIPQLFDTKGMITFKVGGSVFVITYLLHLRVV